MIFQWLFIICVLMPLLGLLLVGFLSWLTEDMKQSTLRDRIDWIFGWTACIVFFPLIIIMSMIMACLGEQF